MNRWRPLALFPRTAGSGIHRRRATIVKHDKWKRCSQSPSSRAVAVQLPPPVLGVLNGNFNNERDRLTYCIRLAVPKRPACVHLPVGCHSSSTHCSGPGLYAHSIILRTSEHFTPFGGSPSLRTITSPHCLHRRPTPFRPRPVGPYVVHSLSVYRCNIPVPFIAITIVLSLTPTVAA